MNNNMIISHRGIHNNKEVPENSLLAFKKAIELNYPIEFDVNMTKDNILIVFHDKNLRRMTGLNRSVKDITYNEIKNLYLLNTKEKIPTLEDVLKLVNGKVFLNIEIKKNKKYKILVTKLVNILNKYNGDYIIQSFNYKSLLILKKNYPSIKRGLLISGNNNCKLYRYISTKLFINICKVNFISISKKLLNKRKYIKISNKYPIYIWTIKNKEELNKYIDNYKGYICDNLPYKE